MTKALRRNGRKVVTVILTLLLVLSTTTPAFAGWASYNGTTYNSGNVYLEEKWFGTQQIIHYYSGGSLVTTAAGQGNTLWIDSRPVLNNLYDTCYWCFDKWGNIFAIDTAQNLLLCRSGTTTFVVNTSVRGCTGFQRDDGKIGYWVYTNNGTYSLEELLRGNNYSTNFNNGNASNNNNSYVPTYYPYVEQSGTMLYYYESSSRYYIYSWNGSTLSYRGSNSSNSNYTLATSVTDVVFNDEGYDVYIVYADSNDNVYRYPLGKTSKSYRQKVGQRFSYFVEYDFMSDGYYNKSGTYKDFDVVDDEEDDEYPRVKKDGSYYYYYTSSSQYYKYYLSNSILYYKGTRNSSSSTILARNVRKIIFSDEGYIVYANTSDDVYAYEIGKTSTSYRVYIGEDFDYFEDNDDDYISDDDGYIDDYEDWIDFDF